MTLLQEKLKLLRRVWCCPNVLLGSCVARHALLIILTAACFLAISFESARSELGIDRKFAEVSGWRIGFSDSVGGCVAAATYKDQTTIWLGFTSKKDGAYIAFTNPKWGSIEADGGYSLQLNMDRRNWKGNFTGFELQNQKGVYAVGLKDEFILGIARSSGVRIFLNQQPVSSLSLSGSTNALTAVLNCQKEAREATSGSKSEAAKRQQSSGTGFFVSSDGHVLTNNHVIDGCSNVAIKRFGMPDTSAFILAKDKTNDLAILKTGIHVSKFPAQRSQVKLGEPIFVFGFPLSNILTTTGNFTTGIVTGTAGISDDSRLVQISAPVQPGNSGGPLIDKFGNIVGVIVSKLNAMNIATATNDIPQNVNFAIKSSIAINFLESNTVSPNSNVSLDELSSEAIAESAKHFTVRVVCN